MLCESECVVVDLLAEPADEVPDLVLDLGQLGLGLLRDLDHVELGVDVACDEKDVFVTFSRLVLLSRKDGGIEHLKFLSPACLVGARDVNDMY